MNKKSIEKNLLHSGHREAIYKIKCFPKGIFTIFNFQINIPVKGNWYSGMQPQLHTPMQVLLLFSIATVLVCSTIIIDYLLAPCCTSKDNGPYHIVVVGDPS